MAPPIEFLHSWIDQWAGLVSRVPEEIALVALVVPALLALFSRRIGIVLGCIVLAAVAFCVFASPSNATITLASALYFGSLVVALSGILARRRAATLQAEISTLRSDINRLLDAEETRVLREMRSFSQGLSFRLPNDPARSVVPDTGDVMSDNREIGNRETEDQTRKQRAPSVETSKRDE